MDNDKTLHGQEPAAPSQQNIESNPIKLPDEKKIEEDDRDTTEKEDGKPCCNKCPTCRKKANE